MNNVLVKTLNIIDKLEALTTLSLEFLLSSQK